MRTNVKLLTLEDLCRELGVVYRDAGRSRKEIVAEITRRIEVRDRIVKHLLDSDRSDYAVTGDAISVSRDADDGTMIYEIDGERVL